MDECPHETAALRRVIDKCPYAAQQLFRVVSIYQQHPQDRQYMSVPMLVSNWFTNSSQQPLKI